MPDLSTATRGVSPPTSEMDKLLEDRARAEQLLEAAVAMIAEANDLTASFSGVSLV